MITKKTGVINIPAITATNSSGALTIKFTSDDYIVSKGWKAKITNTDFVTDVRNNNSGLPKKYALMNNYPNPFNPSTTIGFALPKKDIVSLEVYNILGQKVTTLLQNVEYNAGVHKVVWNGTNQFSQSVTSGVYLFRIKTKSFVQTKRMLLLK
mgnify:CR=1 FL=1